MRTVLCIIMMVALFSQGEAAVLRVGLDGASPYQTVQAAVDAASSGDTVVVAPGLGYASFSVTKRVLVVGAGTSTLAGEFSRIDGTVTITGEADSTELRGLWIRAQVVWMDSMAGALQIRSGAQGIKARRCFLENIAGGTTNITACLSVGSWVTVTCIQCVLQSSGSPNSRGITGENKEQWHVVLNSCAVVGSAHGVSAWHITSCAVSLDHCIFSGAVDSKPFNTTSLAGTIENSVFLYDGTSNWGPGTLFYNYSAFSSAPPAGTGNIAADSTALVALNFGNARLSDYHLSATSVCRDSGNPAGAPDLDGSRSDRGIYGGQHPYVDGGVPDFPFAVGLEVPANVPRDGVLPIWCRGRVGPDY